MRINVIVSRLVASSSLWVLGAAFGQGTVLFQNLDFESALVPDIPAGQYGINVPSSEGLPGWTPYTYYPDRPDGTVLHNSLTLSAPSVDILGPFWSESPILQGNYTVLLQASFPGWEIKPAIAQLGTLPAEARSIEYLAREFYGLPGVSFAGEVLPASIVGGSAQIGYLMRADISALAGQTGELRFFGSGYLDDIRFTSVPEPSTLGLLALGGLLFARRIGKRESL